LLCVMSMLSSPNCSSPANVDAGVEWRRNRRNYTKRVKKLVEKSVLDLPDGFKIPPEKKKIVLPPTPMTPFSEEFEYEVPGEDDDDFDDMEDEDTGTFDEDDGELSDISPEEMAKLEEEARLELEEEMQIDD